MKHKIDANKVNQVSASVSDFFPPSPHPPPSFSILSIPYTPLTSKNTKVIDVLIYSASHLKMIACDV